MAAEGPVQDLCNEMTCPICLDYFTNPVTIVECGHNFCQACLTKFWGKGGKRVSCPQCRGAVPKRNFIPNRQLQNCVEIAKKLHGQKRAREAEGVCKTHREPLKLFCREHEAPICVVCDRSKEHESHKVIPQEEAFQEYKDQISSRLEILRAEKEKILTCKADAEKESQDLLNQIEEEKQKTKGELQQIRQFLEEREKSLLAQTEKVEKEIARRRDEHMARLCRDLSSLENVIQEMEEKCQQPASEFLQDIGRNLQRCKKMEAFRNPVAFPSKLTCRIRELSDRKPLLTGIMKRFPDLIWQSCPSAEGDGNSGVLSDVWASAANVTLDPDTAHPQLVLSKDHKSVTWGDEWQTLPNNPERFDRSAFVLGCEGFTACRHFWEVTVGGEGYWAVGVASKSVRRKHTFDLSPKEGIWAVGKWGSYRVFNAPDYTPLSLSQELKSIRVTLNCVKGEVAFSDTDTGTHLYTYSGVPFYGETLIPFFYVFGKVQLSLSP
ncbi:zinc finger protein RFP-like [Tiliqua scincoides]|uniref:zinc finger protein RFP-like n=1 Tax=Tiliqua scincoides TaxID=71010 RepID=UPI003463366B